MCMPAPKLPPPPPPVPAPIPPPPPPSASATAKTVSQAGAQTTGRQRSKNLLRTDQGGADSVASGLNIPV